MALINRILCIALIVLLAACQKSDNTDSSDDSGGGAGAGGGGLNPGGATGQVVFAFGNYEGDVKHIGPRVHFIVAEVFRVLEILHNGVDEAAGTMDGADAIPARMIEANDEDIETTDPLYNHDCFDEMMMPTAAISNFFVDADNNDLLSDGDAILRTYDNVVCEFDVEFETDPPPRTQPESIAGSIRFDFTAGSDAATSMYFGTARFTNYAVVGGLLNVTEAGNSEIFNGTIEFEIDLASGDATFRNVTITMDGGSGSLTAPIDLTVTEIVRDLGAIDSVRITGGSVVSQVSGLEATFETVNYNGNTTMDLRATTGTDPREGALVFLGDNSGARLISLPSGGSSGIQLDDDGDGDYDDAISVEPTGWRWVVGDFLLPDA